MKDTNTIEEVGVARPVEQPVHLGDTVMGRLLGFALVIFALAQLMKHW